MAVHSFWIFDRHTNCIFHREYNHSAWSKATTTAPVGTGQEGNGRELYPGRVNVLNDSNESKLLYGMIHSLRNIANELTVEKEETDTDEFHNSLQLNNNNKVYTLNTLNYKMQILETLSGLKLVALTDVGHRPLRPQLAALLRDVLLPLVVENPMAAVESTGAAGAAGAAVALAPAVRGEVPAGPAGPAGPGGSVGSVGSVRGLARRDALFVAAVDRLLL